MKNPTSIKKKADQYNDPSHNYLRYWDGRDYENAAEQIAISRLLKGKRFKHAADIGGGYGRLCVFLKEFADKVTLAEPSRQQLDIGKEFLKDEADIDMVLTQADDLKFKAGELDLITMIRVMHHLPDPAPEFRELARVLSKDGYLILEVANYAHGRNRVKHFLKGQRLPTDPVDIRSEKNKREEEIPFVNHNPKTVQKQLAHAGLKVEKSLSVSNLRSPALKKLLPRSAMLAAERVMQPALAKTYFGPSVFFLIKKAS
ncbi:class I SAM-dependent methyltransferase [Candidatus Saccharibacteria bacterium]|nr:class I SAM-dependent methyltransferase [Candidatus Saccharibacteria bacterium]